MKVLIACEESQRVCKAFRDRGHIAYSCDIQEPSGGHPEWHIHGDVLPLLGEKNYFETMDEELHYVYRWDLIIAHPSCQYLSLAGNRSYSLRCNPEWKVKGRIKKREEAVDFFMKCYNAKCDKVCVENPLGYMNSHWRKPDQIIHPYYFASQDDKENYVMKKACLWLKGLPLLRVPNPLPPEPEPVRIQQKGINNGKKIHWEEAMKGGKERSKNRSKTFSVIAEAFAENWG